MPKYAVYGLYTVSKFIGEYEAESPEKAIEKAGDDPQADHWLSVCHQCSKEIDVTDDPYKYNAEER